MDAAARREGALGAAQVIRSPEQVALDLPIAGPMSRILAFSVDYAVILVLEALLFTGLFMAALSMAQLEQLEGLSSWLQDTQAGLENGNLDAFGGWLLVMLAVWITADFLLQTGYFIACELLMQGRSPGKASFGLRVVRVGGLPITLRESALRNLLRVVDMLPLNQYLVGFVSMVVSKDVRRIGDFAAGTIVVRDERAPAARPLDLETARPGARAFRFDREQLAAMGPVEMRLVRQTLRRLDELPTWKGQQVLERTVEALVRRIGWQEELAAEHRRDFLTALLRDAEGR